MATDNNHADYQRRDHITGPAGDERIYPERGTGDTGKVVGPDGTPRIRAVHRHDYGLGPLVRRPADLGHDPADTPVETDYLHNRGPSPNASAKYVGAAGVLAQPSTARQGFPRHHEASVFATWGDDIATALGLDTVT